MEKELICIVCPKGCHLKVDIENETVTGNTCKRGEFYGINEIKNPIRTVTSTVKIKGLENKMLSVKTKEAIPKGKIFEVMKAIDKAQVELPVVVGQVILKDILGTGVDLIATKSIK